MIDPALWGTWYPDVVELGTADVAWQAEFDRLGSRFAVLADDPDNPRTAIVADNDRSAFLILSPWERKFILSLRTEEKSMLGGYAPDLAIAAGAAHAWLSGAQPATAAETWPFLGSVALAIARERGDHGEARWLDLYENHRAEPVAKRLQPFVALAFHEPRLRRLRPYTSHWSLHFSTTATLSDSDTLPVVVPAEAPGRYIVASGGGRIYDESDAATALQLVLTHIRDE